LSEPLVDIKVGETSFHALHRDGGFWERIAAGDWESHTLAVLAARLGPGHSYIDIGSWIGPTVLLAAALGAGVLAFEPDPVARDELERNLEANPELAARVTVCASALSDFDGRHTIVARHDLGDSMSSLVRAGGSSTHEGRTASVQVEDARTRSQSVEFKTANLWKIDIEGGEYLLLPALRSALEDARPDLLLSLHSYHLKEAVRNFPRGVGFAVRRLRDLRNRSRLRWLYPMYPHIYKAEASSGGRSVVWSPIDDRTGWLRFLFANGEQELFLSRTPLTDGTSNTSLSSR
jgi:FkbM family methyltransferase